MNERELALHGRRHGPCARNQLPSDAHLLAARAHVLFRARHAHAADTNDSIAHPLLSGHGAAAVLCRADQVAALVRLVGAVAPDQLATSTPRKPAAESPAWSRAPTT